MMRTVFRKSSIVLAPDLRERRQKAGITTERMADLLEVSDIKHISAIELGKCSITTEKAVRAAYLLGGLTLELPGLGLAALVPIRERTTVQYTGGDLRPGEAAWVALEEVKEAAEQVVCDVTHAMQVLGAALDAEDPTILPQAQTQHATKLMKRGVRPLAGAP